MLWAVMGWPKLPFLLNHSIFFMAHSIKEMYQYKGLYGDDIIIAALKNKFKSVVYTNKSIPGPGSPCKPSSQVADGLIIKRLIFHRNNEITAITQHGNLKFF